MVGSAVAGTRFPLVKSRVCGSYSPGGAATPAVPSNLRRGGWAVRKDPDSAVPLLREATSARSLPGQLCARSPSSPQMARGPQGGDSFSGIRGVEQLWSVLPSSFFLLRGARFLLSFPKVLEAGSPIHDPIFRNWLL